MSIEALWEREQRWEPAHERRRLNIARNRKARRWRFLNSFLVMLMFELLIGYCVDVLGMWQNWVLCLGWALFIAILAAFLGGAKKVGQR
jgi:hypothetical protein